MTLLPVIDVLNGVTVRGVAGRREEYRPLQSCWSTSADPSDVASALRTAFGFRRFYLADLDGILRQQPNQTLYRSLQRSGFELLVDAGVRTANDAENLFETGITAVIAGLETLRSPSELAGMIRRFGPERIVFSLDLKSGKPQVSDKSAWPALDPLSLAEIAIDSGVQQVIVLDLADVGVGTGGSTAELCGSILTKFPHVHLIAGGGVRGKDDLERWARIGISELLVASALHDRRLSPNDVREIPHAE